MKVGFYLYCDTGAVVSNQQKQWCDWCDETQRETLQKCVGPYLHSSYGMYAGAGASSLHFNHAVV